MPIDTVKTIQVKDRGGDGYIDREDFAAALADNNFKFGSTYRITQNAYVAANLIQVGTLEADYANYLSLKDDFNKADSKPDQVWSEAEIDEIFRKNGKFQVNKGGSITIEVAPDKDADTKNGIRPS